MSVLTIEELTFGGMGPVTLHVPSGECLVVRGPSGAGKSRLLRAIADLDPHEGRVSLGAKRSTDVSGPEWRRMVAYLPSESHWWRETVADHMTDGAEALLERVGLDPACLDWRVDRLSSGERQRLSLVRLLAVRPRALLLDEPTANLDPQSAALVEALLLAWRHDHSAPVLWVTHDEGQATRVGERRALLRDGRLAEVTP